MQWLVLLLLVIVGATATTTSTCGKGEDGRDGLDLAVTVVTDHVTGCYHETFSDGAVTSLVFCNGTNAGACPLPTVSTLNQAPGCASISGVGAVLFCNGSTGATGSTGTTGTTGAAGAVGPPVTILTTNQAAGCAIVTGTGAAVLCNGTSDTVGATGPQGLQGPVGVSGTNGVAGAAGPQGPTGLLPNTFIVGDGTYTLDISGINNALTAAAAAGGGTVYIVGTACTPPAVCTATPVTITSPCGGSSTGTISIPSGVKLDLGGNTIAMSPNSAVCNPLINLNTATLTTVLPTTSLIANSTEGSMTVTIAANSMPSALVVGAVCALGNGNTGGDFTLTAQNQNNVVTALNNVAGLITFRNPLVANFGNSLQLPSTISCTVGQSTGQGLRNGFISLNGNSGSASIPVRVGNSFDAALSRLVFQGTTTSNGFSGLLVQDAVVDAVFEHITFDTVSGLQSNIWLLSTINSFFYDIKVLNAATTGIQVNSIHHNVFSEFEIATTNQYGFSVQSSRYNLFDDVVVTGPSYGVLLQASSQHNIFVGTVIMHPSFGLVPYGPGDSYNQFWEATVRGASSTGYLLNDAKAVGNYADGEVTNNLINAASTGGGTAEPARNNILRSTVSTNGYISVSLHNTTVTAADFTGPRQMIITASNDGAIILNAFDGTSVTRSTVSLS